jgi:undecaprenyl-diphosphatase
VEQVDTLILFSVAKPNGIHEQIPMEYLASVIMGLVEGITEFLPISSTGHLKLADHLLGFEDMIGKDPADAFAIIIQLGAILAIVAAFPGKFKKLLQFQDNRGFSGFRGIGLLAITSIPAALLGLVVRKYIHERLLSPLPIAVALATGGAWILLVERFRPRVKTENIDSLTWKEALAVGLFQCLSLWPGMSRATSTILGGMMFGVERKTATEYSFFAAVPIMIAATMYELYKSREILSTAHVGLIAVGFVVSFISAWLAVKTFIRFLSHHTLEVFGWYRLVVAALVIWLMQS